MQFNLGYSAMGESIEESKGCCMLICKIVGLKVIHVNCCMIYCIAKIGSEIEFSFFLKGGI